MIRALLVLTPEISSILAVWRTTRLSPLIGCLGALGLLLMIVSLLPPLYLVHTYLQFTFFYLVIVEALLRGVADGQDILTLSLGGPDGWTESSSSVVASRIAASGKVVTIAAGNDVRPFSESFCKLDRLLMLMVKGATGSWYSSSPGNGVDVISVSSVDK